MSSSNNYDLWEEEKKRSIGGEWQTTCTTNHHQHVVDIELGRKQVPKAVGFLTWKDDFFATSQTSESQNNDLVAVFDRDHESLVSYYMKVSIANQVIPTMTFLMLAALLMSLVFWMNANNNVDEELRRLLVTGTVLVFVLGTVCTPLSLYGDYRIIQSQVYAQHVAVVRDGVRIVQDNTISGSSSMLAALHCFDECLFVSGPSVTIPFDQIKSLSVSNPGAANWDMPWCTCLCFCCLRQPFLSYPIGPWKEEDVIRLSGLLQPQQFCNLVWAMKRAKGEQILSDMRDELRFGNAQCGESITRDIV